MIISTLILTMLGCGSPAPLPSDTPEGKLCGRAYSSTIDSLEDLFHGQGQNMPEVMTKKDYVEKCVAAGFSEKQLKCLDPKLSTGDEACKKELDSVKEKVKALSEKLIKKDAKKDAKDPKKAEPAKAAPK